VNSNLARKAKELGRHWADQVGGRSAGNVWDSWDKACGALCEWQQAEREDWDTRDPEDMGWVGERDEWGEHQCEAFDQVECGSKACVVQPASCLDAGEVHFNCVWKRGRRCGEVDTWGYEAKAIWASCKDVGRGYTWGEKAEGVVRKKGWGEVEIVESCEAAIALDAESDNYYAFNSSEAEHKSFCKNTL